MKKPIWSRSSAGFPGRCAEWGRGCFAISPLLYFLLSHFLSSHYCTVCLIVVSGERSFPLKLWAEWVGEREREREQQENPNIGGTYFERGSRRKAFIIGLSERRGSFSDQISERQCKIFGGQRSQFSEHKWKLMSEKPLVTFELFKVG